MDHAGVLRHISEIETPMQGLWDRATALEDYTAGTWAVEKTLPKDLLTVAPMGSHDYLYDEARSKGKMKRPVELRVIPTSDLQRYIKTAGYIEDIKAGWLTDAGFSPGSLLLDEILTGICSRTHVDCWSEWSEWRCPYQLPDETDHDYNERCDQSMRSWFGWRMVCDPVQTTSFMEHRHIVTVSSRNIRYPVIDFMQQFGSYDRTDQLTEAQAKGMFADIAGTQFPLVAVGEGESERGRVSSANQFITVKLIDNASVTNPQGTISCYVQGINRDGKADNTWHEVQSMQSPLGRNSLSIATGMYQPGMDMAHRFNPMNLSLIRAYRTRDSLRSLLTSLMHAAIKMNVQELGDAVGAAMLGADDKTQAKLRELLKMPGDGEVMLSLGKMASLVNPDSVKLVQDIYNDVKEDIARMRPSGAVNNSADETISPETATAILADLQQEELGFQSAIESYTRLVQDKDAGFEYFYTYGLNPSYEKGSKKKSLSDKNIYYVTKGKEPVGGGREVEPGVEHDMSPAEWDFPKTITIETVSTDERSRQIHIATAMRLYYTEDGKPLITRDQLHEAHGVTNVEKHKKNLNRDASLQLESAKRLQQASDLVDKCIELEYQMAPGSLLGVAVANPDGSQPGDMTSAEPPPQGGGGGGSGGQVPAGGGQHMSAPSIPQANATATGGPSA